MRAVSSAPFAFVLLALAGSARAQSDVPRTFELPWTDVAPLVDARAGVVRTAAIAAPDMRIGRFAPRRAFARRSARSRALEALHAWLDRTLGPLRADPRAAQAAHEAIDESARVEGVRPLVDGGAVAVVVVPLSALREACAVEGAPWMR